MCYSGEIDFPFANRQIKVFLFPAIDLAFHISMRCVAAAHHVIFNFQLIFVTPRRILVESRWHLLAFDSLLRFNKLLAALATDNWMDCVRRNIPNLISHSHSNLCLGIKWNLIKWWWTWWTSGEMTFRWEYSTCIKCTRTSNGYLVSHFG